MFSILNPKTPSRDILVDYWSDEMSTVRNIVDQYMNG